VTVALFVLILMCGCASSVVKNSSTTASLVPTPPMPPMPPTPNATVSSLISVVQKSSITPSTNPPPSIELTWTENYMPQFTNEQTAIEETTDFVTWATVFTGATNECWIPEESPFGFYRAYNFLP
jgi:hypothetical protein